MDFLTTITTRKRFVEDYEGTDLDLIEARRTQMLKKTSKLSYPVVVFFGFLALLVYPQLGSFKPLEYVFGTVSHAVVFVAALISFALIARAMSYARRLMAKVDLWVRVVCWLEMLTGRTVAMAFRSVEEVHETPTRIELDTTGDAPALSWNVYSHQVKCVSRTEVAIDASEDLDSTSFSAPEPRDGRLDLSSRRTAFDLTRSKGRLCLQCRSTEAERRGEALTFVFDRPEWLEQHLYDALPQMARDGVELDADQGGELLRQIAALASIQGMDFPVRAEITVNSKGIGR